MRFDEVRESAGASKEQLDNLQAFRSVWTDGKSEERPLMGRALDSTAGCAAIRNAEEALPGVYLQRGTYR